MEKILIHSYKGGTGKTTIALNTSNLLANSNKKVLLIENDFLMPSFFTIFNHEPKFYFNDYFIENATIEEIIVPDLKPNLDVIFANKKFNPNDKIMGSNQEWFLSALETMMEDFVKLESIYDYIIFDTPPGWHLIVVNLIALSSRAILLLRPNSFAIEGTKRMIDILYRRAKPMKTWNVNFMFNQVPEIDMRSDLKKWAEELETDGLKYIGHISCSCKTSYQMAHEVTIFPADHEFNKELNLALNKII